MSPFDPDKIADAASTVVWLLRIAQVVTLVAGAITAISFGTRPGDITTTEAAIYAAVSVLASGGLWLQLALLRLAALHVGLNAEMVAAVDVAGD